MSGIFPSRQLKKINKSWPRLFQITSCGGCLFCCNIISPAFSQTSTVSDVVSTTVTSTFSTGTGFSITNNGSGLTYGGPLNSISNQAVTPTLQVTLNGESLINGVPTGVAESIPSGTIRINTLSPQLETAKLDIDSSQKSVSLGIGGTVPSFTQAGGSILARRTETFSGPFSIFPNLQPSVFNAGVASSIAEDEARTFRDACRFGSIKTDVIQTDCDRRTILSEVPKP